MSKEKANKQHHPLFAALLRLRLQSHYDVRTNLAVGDIPREADIVLVQLRGDQPNPFAGLWRHLTPWSVIEYKGPTVSGRVRDLDLLVDVGLGIDRRLNKEQARQGHSLLDPEQVSFWYIANSIGRRFLADSRRRLGLLEEIRPGLGRSQILQRLVFLVSSEHYATEADSVPLHLIAVRAPEQERELVDVIFNEPTLQRLYLPTLSALHPEIWKEVKDMARVKSVRAAEPDFSGLVELYGLPRLLEWFGPKQVMEALGPKRIIKEMGVDWLVSNLSPEDRKKLKERLK